MADAGTSTPLRHSEEAADRFLAINRERLQRVRDCLSQRQQDVFDLLPLLFHANIAQLPAYVSSTTPAGIYCYVPDQNTLSAARRISRGYNADRRALQRHELLGVYLMGSSGTIAHSGHSDFDVWVCYPEGLPQGRLEELRRKAAAIEAWAAAVDLEMHFFVFSPAGFRLGESQRLSAESSGSTQHYLLLDEFYRSGVVIAGALPLWMQVPPEQEDHYEEAARELEVAHERLGIPTVDFGGLPRVPAAEFFGATVWQLYKSIDSPYKSVLKLLLMEAYAAEYPDIDLLSQRYKRAVYAGETSLDVLDPYVLMYRKVEEYLMARNDASRLDLLRRCFYLKINERLSEPPQGRSPGWRRELIERIVLGWGWNAAQIRLLDAKDSWRFHTVRDESRQLVAALTASYRMLSQFARRQTENLRITQADLNTLGRRLYAAFERKAGKVELVNRGITPDLLEERVSIHQLGQGAEERWVVFPDRVAPEDLGSATPMKQGRSLLELLAWGHFNKVIDAGTILMLHAQSPSLTQRETKAILEALEDLYPGGRIAEATAESLNQAPAIWKAALFVNVGIDPMGTKLRDGQHLATARTDALSYGGLHENLAQSCDLVIASTWEEVFTYRYTGPAAVLDCLIEYLRWSPPGAGTPPPLPVHCHSSTYGASITRRIQELFRDVIACFHAEGGRTSRYILQIGEVYHQLAWTESLPVREMLPGEAALLRHLGRPQTAFRPVAWDRHLMNGQQLLPQLYAVNRADVIQAFFQPVAGGTTVYVLDELGTLFHQEVANDNKAALIQHYRRFFASLVRRRRNSGPDAGGAELAVEMYLVRERRGGSPGLLRLPDDQRDDAAGFVNVQVIGELDGSNNTQFTIYCNDREYSPLEYGSDVFRAVAADIRQLRRAGPAYPVYITDLDISRTLVGERAAAPLQTVTFLHYKKTIEERLTSLLRAG